MATQRRPAGRISQTACVLVLTCGTSRQLGEGRLVAAAQKPPMAMAGLLPTDGMCHKVGGILKGMRSAGWLLIPAEQRAEKEQRR
jgi:hypothetical protein